MVAELWVVGGVFGREGYNLEIPRDLITHTFLGYLDSKDGTQSSP